MTVAPVLKVLVAYGLSCRSHAEISPFAEPAVSDFFKLPEGSGPFSVERVRDVAQDEFDSRIRAGRPFIVEDAARGNSLVGVSCEAFHKRFPGAQMRAEYTGGERETFVSLGTKSWFDEDRFKRPQEEHISQGSTPLNAPYVWHVKDGGHEAPPKIREAVQRSWEPPYFVKGATNLREANESIEFWFSRRKGAVLAHADTYCIPAVSLQLRGKKQWQLMPPPPIGSMYDRYDAHDGGIYKTGLWKPLYEATVSEGEAIVFFPNWFHETFIPEDNPDCTVATTFQFQLPVPVRYLRAYLPTHIQSHLYYEGHCSELWHSYATLRPPPGRPGAGKATLNDTKLAAAAGTIFREADADLDGKLSAAEIKSFLSAAEPPWPRWFLTEDYFYDFRPAPAEKAVMSQEVLEGRTLDTLAYQDTDGDGMVSASELYTAFRQWSVVHRQLWDAAKAGKKSGRQGALQTERRFIERYPGGGRVGSTAPGDNIEATRIEL